MIPPAEGRSVRRDERGFTLVEVLVVTVIIGVLAAIAIPLFLGESKKADDAGAKSDVNRLAKMVEECRLEKESYADCDEETELGGAPGLSWGGRGANPGEVGVTAAGATSFAARAVSRAQTDGSFHVFVWRRRDDDSVVRRCRSGGAPFTGGGCRDGLW